VQTFLAILTEQQLAADRETHRQTRCHSIHHVSKVQRGHTPCVGNLSQVGTSHGQFMWKICKKKYEEGRKLKMLHNSVYDPFWVGTCHGQTMYQIWNV